MPDKSDKKIDEKYLEEILENLNNISMSIDTIKEIFLNELRASEYEKSSMSKQRLLIESIRRKQKELSDYYWDLTKLSLVVFTLAGLAVSVIPQGILDSYTIGNIFNVYFPFYAGALFILILFSLFHRIRQLTLNKIKSSIPFLVGGFTLYPIILIGGELIRGLATDKTLVSISYILGMLIVAIPLTIEWRVLTSRKHLKKNI